MEKEFLPYEQALELKYLGFDEPCLGYFHFGKQLKLGKHRTSQLAATIGPATPTYSQAFRWFREKYRLHHNIVYLKFKKQYLTETEGTAIYFDETEYEKAELECLKKLIEIVKNK